MAGKKTAPQMDREKLCELLITIPRGCVITYGQLAERLGNKRWARAVGNALHQNPNGDCYPCYKAISSKGKLSGAYAFGGIEVQKHRFKTEAIAMIKDHVDLAEYAVPLN